MIQELTKENLQKLGFKEADLSQLYNAIDTYNLQCNEGNVFVSKTENKLYTGIDFYRKIYLNNRSLRFPHNCPDLVNEYFDLALVEFLEKQKTVLGLLYNEEDQFNKFKSNEIERSQKRIEGQKEFISKQKHFKFESKENDIQICESYINFLNNKLYSNEKTNTTNRKAIKSDEILENEFDTIFKNNIGFTIFTKMFEFYKDDKNVLANFSFLFHAMEKDFLVCNQTKFREFLRNEKYNIEIEKIDSRQSGKTNKTKLYNSIRDNYQLNTLNAQ